MVFKLHDFYSGAISRACIKSLNNGKGYTTARLEFLPGEEYETHDSILIQYIKGELGDVMEKWVATPDIVAQLQAAGVPFEKKKCSTCSAAQPRVWFNPFKIVEE